MSSGVSHITFIVSDLDRMQEILEKVLKARCVYDSGESTFSLAKERFFLVGDIWIATMEGPALESRTYNHVAFQIDESEFDACCARIDELGLDLRPPRARVEGEGRSLYFYGPDNHLFELHTGTLAERLQRYAKGGPTTKQKGSGMTRTVIFDIGGVLIDWNPKHLFTKLLPDDAAIEAYLSEIGFDAWNRALDAGGLWEPAIAELVGRYPHHKALIEALHLRWHEMLPGDIPGTVAILERLAAQDVPLYAITNYSTEKWIETRARFPFFAHFRDIVVSGDEKMLKPDAAIYRLCLERNGLAAEDCVFIDDVARNVAAAKSVGIDAIQFESPEKLAEDLTARGILK